MDLHHGRCREFRLPQKKIILEKLTKYVMALDYMRGFVLRLLSACGLP